MVQAHRIICPVEGKQLHIDLPSDFPEGSAVEVIVLPLSTSSAALPDVATTEWLREIWACSPDFPDRQAMGEERLQTKRRRYISRASILHPLDAPKEKGQAV